MLAYEYLSNLRKLDMLPIVTLTWIPWPSEIQGNMKADTLARQGALKNFIGPEPCFPIERNWVKRNLDAWA